MKLSIIIVHYKTPQLLLEAIKSIYSNKPDFEYEIIVVDNDSIDNSKEIIKKNYPNVFWIDSGYNAGFARGNNLGIKNSIGDYLLLLNPDCNMKSDFLQKMLDAYIKIDSQNNLGLLGCRIISSLNGQLLVGTGIGFPSFKKYLKANPIYIYLTRRHFTPSKKYIPVNMHLINHEVDFVSGACVMIKKSKIYDYDLFLDEDFFLYSEDVEWSYRVKKRGFVNYFLSNIEIYHINSAITSKSLFRSAQMQVSEYLYLYKTKTAVSYFLLGLLLRCNFFLIKKLLVRKNQQEELLHIIKEEAIFKQYFNKIPRWYKKQLSSAKKSLIYAQ